MQAILNSILLNGYTSVKEHPEISDAQVRNDLAKEVEQFGAHISYHAGTATLTMFMDAHDEGYTPYQRVALFVAWLELVKRDRAYQRVAVNEGGRLTLRSDRLARVYRNVFPKGRATMVLGELVDMRFLVRAGANTFAAGPLLPHAFDDAAADDVIQNELAGLFDDLKPAAPRETLRDLLLREWETTGEAAATRRGLIERLPQYTWKDMEEELRLLMDEGLVESTGQGGGRHYRIAEATNV